MSVFGCGGGSSGTELGGSGELRLYSGLVVSPDGDAVPFARVVLLNTDDAALTDEAGAFELQTSFISSDATLEVTAAAGESAAVEVSAPDANDKNIDLSILFDPRTASAELLALTLRARIVGNCGPFFLNTRTIRQISAVTEGLACIIEADFRENGLPANGLIFQLQHRGCNLNDPWEFSGISKTGTSGPGVGEIEFKFRNDEKHCVYRIVGPLNTRESVPVSVQINTLRKEQFDRDN